MVAEASERGLLWDRGLTYKGVTGCRRVYRAIYGLGMVWGLGFTVVEEFWLCVFGLLWLRVLGLGLAFAIWHFRFWVRSRGFQILGLGFN